MNTLTIYISPHLFFPISYFPRRKDNLMKALKRIGLLFTRVFVSLQSEMGCVNGKPVLSDEDLDFIANHTAISRDQVDQVSETYTFRIFSFEF